MNLEDIMLNEIANPQKTNTVWFHLHEVLRVVIIIETQSSMAVARDLEEGRMESYFSDVVSYEDEWW